MGHLTLELILWLLLTFFIGCTLGCLFRKMFGGPAQESTASQPEKSSSESEKQQEEPETKPKEKPATATGTPKRPKGLAAARDNKPDILSKISGVGAKLEKTLHSLGYFHFDQIAAWTPDEVQWVDEHLRFKGRIERDEWQAQASLLAEGKDEEFAKLYASKSKK